MRQGKCRRATPAGTPDHRPAPAAVAGWRTWAGGTDSLEIGPMQLRSPRVE